VGGRDLHEPKYVPADARQQGHALHPHKPPASGGGDVEELLAAARDGLDARVLQYVERLSGASAVADPARSPLIAGKWRLLWSQQADDANPLQKALVGQVRNWQVIPGDGTLENRVELGPVTIRAMARCEPQSEERTGVVIERVLAVALGREWEISSVRRDDAGFVDWLYVNERVRVTRGNRGSLFVHVRDDE